MLSSDETSEEQLEEVMKEVEAEEAEEDAKEQQAVAWLQSREEKKMAIQVGFICCVHVFRFDFEAIIKLLFKRNVCNTGGTKKRSSQSKIWGEADSRAVPGDKSTKCDPV